MPQPTAFFTPELDRWLADINADRQSWAALIVDELIALRREGYGFEDAWDRAYRRVGRPPVSPRHRGGWGTLPPPGTKGRPRMEESPIAFLKRACQAAYERRDLERPAIQDAESVGLAA